MFVRLAALALVLWLPATTVAVHNRLEKSIPAADSTVVGSPKTIELWFTEKVEPKFSSITLLTADSVKIALGVLRATGGPKSIAADIPTLLAPGRYFVTWRTAGDDGHAVRGKFGFSVK